MDKEIQISAAVSAATKDLLDRHTRASGIKKGRLVEDAIRHHLLALEELPADVIVHPRIVVSARSGREILSRMARGEPSQRLRDLFRDGN
jgi:hypothetical protein